jgi:hypothetical protein
MHMKWLPVGAVLAGVVVIAAFALARESSVEPADAVRVQAAAPALPSNSANPVVRRAPKPRPQAPCRALNDEESDPDGDDSPAAAQTRASCQDAGEEREGDEREADENEARDDQASHDEGRDGNDDQAGDSDGSGD